RPAQQTSLARERPRPATIEKEVDRRVLLGCGGRELRPAGARDDFGQGPPQRLIGKRDLGWKALLILGERDEVGERWPVGARKRVPARIEDGMAELSRAVRPKIEEDAAVTVSPRWSGA